MPFLRVIKDKRGYETTYLLHWSRDEERQRSRILYVFRSPTGMPVGRDAFDADVRRRIERENPGISFDWEAVFRQQQVVEPPAEIRRDRKSTRLNSSHT